MYKGVTMAYTENDLWNFVYRADTHEKIYIAERWLRDHFKKIQHELWENLMSYLAMSSLELNRIEQGRI